MNMPESAQNSWIELLKLADSEQKQRIMGLLGQLDTLSQQIRQGHRKGLVDYALTYWGELAPIHMAWYHHMDIVLTGKSKHLAIYAPRGFGKTCTVMTAMNYVRANYPDWKVAYVASSRSIAKEVKWQMGALADGIEFFGNDPYDIRGRYYNVAFIDDVLTVRDMEMPVPYENVFDYLRADQKILIATPPQKNAYEERDIHFSNCYLYRAVNYDTKSGLPESAWPKMWSWERLEKTRRIMGDKQFSSQMMLGG